jgi:hypothetical protein
MLLLSRSNQTPAPDAPICECRVKPSARSPPRGCLHVAFSPNALWRYIGVLRPPPPSLSRHATVCMPEKSACRMVVEEAPSKLVLPSSRALRYVAVEGRYRVWGR